MAYFARRGLNWQSLIEAHSGLFQTETADLAWNADQVIVLVGQTLAPEILDVERYLRDHKIDAHVLQFSHLESSGGERLVNVQTVVGAEQLPGESSKTETHNAKLGRGAGSAA